MNHTNYFNPYTSASDNHENHLTRAFLVLLRLSNSAIQQFYSYVIDQIPGDNADIKALYEQSLSKMNYYTQTGSLPVASVYLSILITDEKITINDKIVRSERNAVYDGVISFHDDLVFIIETKPRNPHVWAGQLSPDEKDVPEEAQLIDTPVVLEWKEIINFLHRINESEITLPHEKLLINDFFELINDKFDYLNPYNDFSKCHSIYLAERRTEQLLREIAANPDRVAKHRKWGFNIGLDFPEIKKIALLLHLNGDETDWEGLTIAADFGSTVSQARDFYENVGSYEMMEQALGEWSIYCNFHLAFRDTNLVFFKSPENVQADYFNYWQADVDNHFGGFPKEDLEGYLQAFAKMNLITYDPDKQDEVKAKILDKKYQRINLCPALYAEYFIPKEDAVRMDKKGELADFVIEKMQEVLGILGHPLNTTFRTVNEKTSLPG